MDANGQEIPWNGAGYTAELPIHGDSRLPGVEVQKYLAGQATWDEVTELYKAVGFHARISNRNR